MSWLAGAGGKQEKSGRGLEEDWRFPKKAGGECHQTARNGAFYRWTTNCTRSDLEPAMPDRPAGPPPELLTIPEAAELPRPPVATPRFWRPRNTGPHSFRLGRRVLYRRDDLHAWID